MKVDMDEFWSEVSKQQEKNAFYPEAKTEIAEELGVSEFTINRYFKEHDLFQESKGFHSPQTFAVEEYPYTLNDAEKKFVRLCEVSPLVLDASGADFLTRNYLVEVKSTLNKSNFYKAYSQLKYAEEKLNTSKNKALVCEKVNIPEGKEAEVFRFIKVLDFEVYVMKDEDYRLQDSRLKLIESRDDLS